MEKQGVLSDRSNTLTNISDYLRPFSLQFTLINSGKRRITFWHNVQSSHAFTTSCTLIQCHTHCLHTTYTIVTPYSLSHTPSTLSKLSKCHIKPPQRQIHHHNTRYTTTTPDKPPQHQINHNNNSYTTTIPHTPITTPHTPTTIPQTPDKPHYHNLHYSIPTISILTLISPQ